jgi:hypothetical protein
MAHRDATDDGPVRRNWVNSGRAVIGLNRPIMTQLRHAAMSALTVVISGKADLAGT